MESPPTRVSSDLPSFFFLEIGVCTLAGRAGSETLRALVYLSLDFTCTLALDKCFCEGRITRESVTTAGDCASVGSLWGGEREDEAHICS